MTLKDLTDLIPTIGVVGAILLAALWAGNKRLWVFGWSYQELKEHNSELKSQLLELQAKYEKREARLWELHAINSRVADRALEQKIEK